MKVKIFRETTISQTEKTFNKFCEENDIVIHQINTSVDSCFNIILFYNEDDSRKAMLNYMKGEKE